VKKHYKVVWSYRIIYEIYEDFVVILDVIHTSRSPQNLKQLNELSPIYEVLAQ